MRHAWLVLLAACGVNATPQPAPAPTLPTCVPDRDGAIEADELPVALGATATYYEGTNRTFASVATAGVWDLSKEEPTDTVVALGPTALKAQWYAASFATGAFVVDAGDGIDGVYHQDDVALWLDGLASQDPAAATRTLVHYAQPIAVLRFPIVDGDSYTAVAAIPDGVISGLPFVGSDRVTVEVSGEGRLDVPYVRFTPALRVRTRVEREPSSGGIEVTKRTTSFLFECFGEVARAESRVDEADPDFTMAVRLRRFALGVTP